MCLSHGAVSEYIPFSKYLASGLIVTTAADSCH